MSEDPEKVLGAQVPEWVNTHVNLRGNSLPVALDWQYFEWLNRSVAEAVPFELQGLGIVPVYTLDRASRILRSRKSGEEFLLFDCMHAATVKMLYYQITTPDYQQSIFEFMREHVASCLLALRADVEALALFDEKVSSLYSTALPQPLSYYQDAGTDNYQWLPTMPNTLPLVDVYKSCHELFHFAVRKGHPGPEILLRDVENQFDLLVDRVYPEWPTAAHIAGLHTLGYRDGAGLDLSKGGSSTLRLAKMRKVARLLTKPLKRDLSLLVPIALCRTLLSGFPSSWHAATLWRTLLSYSAYFSRSVFLLILPTLVLSISSTN